MTKINVASAMPYAGVRRSHRIRYILKAMVTSAMPRRMFGCCLIRAWAPKKPERKKNVSTAKTALSMSMKLVCVTTVVMAESENADGMVAEVSTVCPVITHPMERTRIPVRGGWVVRGGWCAGGHGGCGGAWGWWWCG
jgi:hypothetical protein